MEEIKVGEYVRTNLGHIGKLKRIELDKNDKGLKWYVFDHKEFEINIVKEEYINKPYILKHSPNIIDLIEEGDYVNGYKVTFIYEDYAKFVQCDYPVEAGRTNHYKFYEKAIKDIVTHEQFNQVKYEVWIWKI